MVGDGEFNMCAFFVFSKQSIQFWSKAMGRGVELILKYVYVFAFFIPHTHIWPKGDTQRGRQGGGDKCICFC